MQPLWVGMVISFFSRKQLSFWKKTIIELVHCCLWNATVSLSAIASAVHIEDERVYPEPMRSEHNYAVDNADNTVFIVQRLSPGLLPNITAPQ